MQDIEAWPLRRILEVHKLLDFKAERNRIVNEV